MDKYIKKDLKFGAQNYAPLPVVLSKGKGVWLWDVEGNSYLDMMSAYSAVSLGHRHPRIIEALTDQAQKLCVTSRAYYSDILSMFLEKLCKTTGFDKALPMNSGAEAVETAIKAARKWGYEIKGIEPNKAEIIVAKHNFHGRTTGIISFTSEQLYKDNFGPLMRGFKEVPFGDAKALEKAITPNVCAFLVEPMQGEAGIIVPPKGWLKEVRSICRKKKILFMLDEIQTGLGRTGKLFAYEHERAKPDCLIVGKALGGGVLPLSAFLASKDVMDVFTPGTHGSTFGGNPLSAAVGIETLNIIKDEKLVKNSAEKGEYIMNAIKDLQNPLVKDVRGKGLWVGVEIEKEFADAREICERLMIRGVLSKETHGTVIRLAPPLVITKQQLDVGLSRLIDVLNETAKDKGIL